MILFYPALKPNFNIVSLRGVLLQNPFNPIHAQIYGLTPYICTLISKVLFCLLYGIALCVCKAFPYSRLYILGEVPPGLILVEYFHAANVCAL